MELHENDGSVSVAMESSGFELIVPSYMSIMMLDEAVYFGA